MGAPQNSHEFKACDVADKATCAADAAEMLRSFAHETRFLILLHLTNGEKTVSDLCALTDCRQSAISQQVGRLRMEGIVKRQRSGKSILYRITDPRHTEIISKVHAMFVNDAPDSQSGQAE